MWLQTLPAEMYSNSEKLSRIFGQKRGGGGEENSRENLTKRKIVANMECYWQNGKQYVWCTCLFTFVYFYLKSTIEFQCTWHYAMKLWCVRRALLSTPKHFQSLFLCTFFFYSQQKMPRKKIRHAFQGEKKCICKKLNRFFHSWRLFAQRKSVNK